MSLINKLEGYRIRAREIHWSTNKHSIHVLCDKIMEELEKHEDEIAEDAQGIFGRIEIGQLTPDIPKETDIIPMLRGLRSTCINTKGELNDERFDGIKSLLDDIIHYSNQWVYLSTF